MRLQLPIVILVGVLVLVVTACCRRVEDSPLSAKQPADSPADAEPSEDGNDAKAETGDEASGESDEGMEEDSENGADEGDESLGDDAPELIRGFDHEPRVTGVDFSPDGKYLIICGGGEVRLLEYQQGLQKSLVKGKDDTFMDVKFRPDSEEYAACTKEGKVYVFDLEGEPVATYDLSEQNEQNAVFRVAYSPDGSQIAAASGDKMTYIWQPKSGQTLHKLLGHDGEVRDVVFDPTDANLTATSGYDRHAKIWDLEKNDLRYSIEHDATVVQALDVSPNGQYLATAGGPGELVRLFDLDTGNELGTIATTGGFEFHRVRWGPEGKTLAVSGGIFSRGYFSLWSIESAGDKLVAKRLSGIHTHKRGAGIYALDISPDGKILATGNAGGRVRLWKTGR